MSTKRTLKPTMTLHELDRAYCAEVNNVSVTIPKDTIIIVDNVKKTIRD